MRAVPRERFLPGGQAGNAGWDSPLAIGHGQTSSQPTTVLTMLTMLDVREGHRVLDVGSGSGWTTALLAWLCGPSGSVLGVERVPDLVEFGAANVAAEGMPWARIVGAGPGQLGAPKDAPYDRILVSAEPPSLPGELVEQLAVGGVMVIPVDGRMLRVRRDEAGTHVDRHGYYRFVPLVTDSP